MAQMFLEPLRKLAEFVVVSYMYKQQKSKMFFKNVQMEGVSWHYEAGLANGRSMLRRRCA